MSLKVATVKPTSQASLGFLKVLTRQRSHGQSNEGGQEVVVERLGHERDEADPDDGREADDGHAENTVAPDGRRARLLPVPALVCLGVIVST